MKKARSPRFPFLSLEKAIEKVSVLKENDCTADFRPHQAMEALGFASMHGRAVKVFAALRAYDLVEKSKNDDRLFSITENGLKASKASQNKNEALPFLQRAALSPIVFRGIWNRAKGVTKDELKARLLERGFTEGGAERAARIYLKNTQFASLDALEQEPEGLPEHGPKRGPDHQRRERGPERHKPNGNPGLSLPLSTGRAIVPTGISEEDFTLLMQTLRLWKDRLVTTQPC